MRIAIIGAGNVGGGLGAGLAAVGHSVVFGVRDPESDKARAALAAAHGATAASPGDAVAGAEVVVFALRPEAIAETVAEIGGPVSLIGHVVIDSMNRFGGNPTRSTAHDLTDLLPGARIVKAFNTIGFENLTTARERAVPAAMFICGEDPEAKAVVASLASELGFEPEDVGGLAHAKPLEEMVKVWLALTHHHGRTVGFAVSRG
jgi:predicted dinucleotide-binding enzyme